MYESQIHALPIAYPRSPFTRQKSARSAAAAAATLRLLFAAAGAKGTRLWSPYAANFTGVPGAGAALKLKTADQPSSSLPTW